MIPLRKLVWEPYNKVFAPVQDSGDYSGHCYLHTSYQLEASLKVNRLTLDPVLNSTRTRVLWRFADTKVRDVHPGCFSQNRVNLGLTLNLRFTVYRVCTAHVQQIVWAAVLCTALRPASCCMRNPTLAYCTSPVSLDFSRAPI